MLLKLLRNFGHLINILGIDYWKINAKICAEFEKNYLAKYCSDSLERLYLDCDKNKITFEHLQQPFKKLTTLGIYHNGFHTKTRYLNDKMLPSLRHMIYLNNCPTEIECEDIHYKNIEYFSLVSIVPMDKFPFTFDNLKHLCVHGSIVANDAFCELIENIKHLKTLKLLIYREQSSDSFRKIIGIQNILLNVVEIEIEFQKSLSLEIILELLKRSKNLKKICFVSYTNPYKYKFELYSNMMHAVTSNLESEWTSFVITSPEVVCINSYFQVKDTVKCYTMKK